MMLKIIAVPSASLCIEVNDGGIYLNRERFCAESQVIANMLETCGDENDSVIPLADCTLETIREIKQYILDPDHYRVKGGAQAIKLLAISEYLDMANLRKKLLAYLLPLVSVQDLKKIEHAGLKRNPEVAEFIEKVRNRFVTQNQREGNYRLRVLRSGDIGHVEVVRATEDGTGLILGTKTGQIKICDKVTGQIIWSVQAHKSGVSGVCEFQRYIVSCSHSSKTIKVWDRGTGICIRHLKGHRSGVRFLTVFRRDARLLSISDDKKVRLWDLSLMKCVKTYREHSRRNGHITFCGGTQDGNGCLFGITAGVVTRLDESFQFIGEYTLNFEGDESRAVKTIVETRYGEFVCVSRGSKGLQVWNKKTGNLVRTFEKLGGGENAVIETDGGSSLVSCAQDGAVRIYDFLHIGDDEADCLPGDVLYREGFTVADLKVIKVVRHMRERSQAFSSYERTMAKPEVIGRFIEIAQGASMDSVKIEVCEHLQRVLQGITFRHRNSHLLIKQINGLLMKFGNTTADDLVRESVLGTLIRLIGVGFNDEPISGSELRDMLIEMGGKTTNDRIKEMILDVILRLSTLRCEWQHFFIEDSRTYTMVLNFGNEDQNGFVRTAVLRVISAITEANMKGKVRFGTKEMVDMLIKFWHEPNDSSYNEDDIMKVISSMSIGDSINLKQLISPKVADMFTAMVEKTPSLAVIQQIEDVVGQVIYEYPSAELLFKNILDRISCQKTIGTSAGGIKSKLKSGLRKVF